MNAKIDFAEISKAAWKGFKSQCWLLMGLLIGFTIVYSILFLFAFPAKGEPMRISGLIVGIICVIFQCLFVMGYLKNCLQTVDGEEPQFSAYGQVSRKLLAFLPVFILFPIVITLGFALFFFPGVYLLLRFQFLFASVVDDETGVIASIKRSWNITKGHTMQLFVLMLIQMAIFVVGMIVLGVGIIAATPFTALMYAYAYRKLTAPTST